MLRSDLIPAEPHFIAELARLGLDAVFVGIESGNSTDLQVFHKRVTTEENFETASILKSLGVFLQIGFIMFSGESSLDSVLSNARFLQSIGQLYRFFPMSRTVQIFPGTELWRE